MKKAVDLRRLIFDTHGARVVERTNDFVLVASDTWVFTVQSLDTERALNVLYACDSSVGRRSDNRSVTYVNKKNARIHKYKMRAGSFELARRSRYVVSNDVGWLIIEAYSRSPEERFDTAEVDKIIDTIEFAPHVRRDMEIPHEWAAYQAGRSSGMPNAKFVVSLIEYAPIRLGSVTGRSETQLVPARTSSGGSLVYGDYLEFHAVGDSSSTRIDIWTESSGNSVEGEVILESALRVTGDSLSVQALPGPFEMSLSSGKYEVRVILRNRGKTTDWLLTDGERFQRDDLEIYEIHLKKVGDSI